MSRISKRVLLASAFAFLVVALVALLVACPSKLTPAGGSATAQLKEQAAEIPPVPARLLTHIGQSAANFVGLRCNRFSGPVCTEFRREHLDGSEDAFPFTIPAGMVFVITDVNWAASAAAGTDVRFFIQSRAPSTLYERTAVADSSGFVAVADHFTTGFAFSTMPGFVMINFRTLDCIGVQGYLVSQSIEQTAKP